MIRRLAATLLLATTAATAPPPILPGTTAGSPAATAPRPPRLPGFAAALSEAPAITGPGGWPVVPRAAAWSALVQAPPERRQAARWQLARSLVGQDLSGEALGVLEVMAQDDPDLTLVGSWQLAHGIALAQLHRPGEALAALGDGQLADNPEACLWRMRAMAEAGLAAPALMQVGCALPAIAARTAGRRAPFVIAAARSAIGAGKPALASRWLKLVDDRDPAANLLRGKAQLALGDAATGRLRLARVEISGTAGEKVDARLTLIEADAAAGAVAPGALLRQLDQISFGWRGDDIERRALWLSARLGADAHDPRRSLAAGATLFRHFDLGRDAAPFVAGLQAQMIAALAPGSALPVAQAAGLYWDFRDLAPAGADGDRLVSQLADRLQAAGLYARAAELLQYQLSARTTDVAQGPLSARVASLFILAGHPEQAIRALRATDDYPYPPEMVWERHRVAAVALQLLGKTNEALAVLQDVPNGKRIQLEIYWQQHDWASLVDAGTPDLPGAGALSDVEQAMVLRHVIALAMLGREPALAGLRGRYGAAFAGQSTASAFDILTRAVATVDPAMITKAMIALPGASPAGRIGDLLAAATLRGKPGGT